MPLDAPVLVRQKSNSRGSRFAARFAAVTMGPWPRRLWPVADLFTIATAVLIRPADTRKIADCPRMFVRN